MDINKIVLECLDDSVGYLIIDCGPRDPLEIDYFLREEFYKAWSKVTLAFEREPKDTNETFWEAYTDDVLDVARIVKLDNGNRILQVAVEPMVFTKKVDKRSNAEAYSDKSSVLKEVLTNLYKQFYNVRILLKLQYSLYPEHEISEKEDVFTLGVSEIFDDLFKIYDNLLLSKITSSSCFAKNLEKIVDEITPNELVELNEALTKIKLNNSVISIVRNKMVNIGED